MSKDKAQLAHCREALLGLLTDALSDVKTARSALKRRVHPTNPVLFDAMVESYDKKIAEIEAEIEGYGQDSQVVKDE